jgi:hypothetical protein
MRVEGMTTEALEAELNKLGCALEDGEECSDRMREIEAELRERFGVNAAVRAVLSDKS